MIYTGNLDIARIWERTLRRAGAPVLYSQGFNPRPKIQIAAALPLGFSSSSEVMDVWLDEDAPPPDSLLESVRAHAPRGLTVDAIWEVDADGPALQTTTTHAIYVITLPDKPDDLHERVEGLLSQDEIIVEGKRKTRDYRPRLLDITFLEEEQQGDLAITCLLSQQKGHLRPDLVLEWLDLDPLEARIHRHEVHYSEPV